MGDFQITLNAPAPSLKIKLGKHVQNVDTTVRNVVGVLPLLRINEPGLSRPLLVSYVPDLQNPFNMIASAVHRYGRDMPRGNALTKLDFLDYSRKFIIKYFKPVTNEDIPSFGEWLDESKYPGGRKKALRKLRDEITAHNRDFSKSKSFLKDEGYEEPKVPRAINSPSDESKVLLGPMIKAIDKATFSTQWFVKGTQPKDWPQMLAAAFGDSKVMETDFSSFESHHFGIFSDIIYYWMMHMLRGVDMTVGERRLIARIVKGHSVSEFKYITTSIEQRLMSGSLWTSSANGVLNLLLMSYLSLRSLHPQQTTDYLVEKVLVDFSGYVEGDDGICRYVDVNQQLIVDLGLRLEFDVVNHFGDASFCGIVCDPQRLTIVSSPLKVLRNFFVLPRRYVNASCTKQNTLLRAKALSYKYNYCHCPIIGPLCDAVLDRTKGLDVKACLSEIDAYKRQSLENAIKDRVWKLRSEVHPSSRYVVEQRFGISVEDQKRIEMELAGKNRGYFEVSLSRFATYDDVVHSSTYLTNSNLYLQNEVPREINLIALRGRLPRQRRLRADRYDAEIYDQVF